MVKYPQQVVQKTVDSVPRNFSLYGTVCVGAYTQIRLARKYSEPDYIVVHITALLKFGERRRV